MNQIYYNMKSIRQKAKDYDKALEIARPYYEEAIKSEKTASVELFKSMFDELRNNDEKIRKEIIDYIKTSTYRKDWIAWLEKQEQKPATIDIDRMVDDYANNKERGNEVFGKPVPCMVRAYRQGLNDAIGKVVLKHSWSEEDELMLLSIIQSLETTNGAAQIKIDWLKTIKQRIGGE